MRAHPTLAAVAAAATLLITGCSGESEAPVNENTSRAMPSSAAPETYAPIDQPPVEFRTVSGEHYEISVPGSWEERKGEDPRTGNEQVALIDTGAPAGTNIFAGVVVDGPDAVDVYDQAIVIEGDKRSQGVEELTRESLDWPNSEGAVRLTWHETPRGGSQALQYEQLMVQVRPGVIVNVVAAAPVDIFPTTELPTVLRTLKVSE